MQYSKREQFCQQRGHSYNSDSVQHSWWCPQQRQSLGLEQQPERLVSIIGCWTVFCQTPSVAPGLLSTTEQHNTASFFLLWLSRSQSATVPVQQHVSTPCRARNEQWMTIFWIAVGITNLHLLECMVCNMLCANHGSGQSMDCAAQSMDPCFAQQSMDCPLNPWIAQTRDSKYGSRPNHGWTLGSGGLCMNETTFATEAPPGSNCCLIAY